MLQWIEPTPEEIERQRTDPQPLDVYPSREVAGQLVGRGWASLVDEAFDVAEECGRRVVQVKEKFGGLRFYHEASDGPEGTKQASDRIAAIEDRSFHICEACGAPGELRDLGWHKTLCDTCHQRRLAGETWRQIFGAQPLICWSNSKGILTPPISYLRILHGGWIDVSASR